MWDIRRDWIGTQEGIRLGLSWYCCRQRWYSVPDFCGGSTSLPFSQRVHLHTVAAVCMLAIKRNKEFRADPRQTTALFTDGNPAVIVLLNAVLAGRDFRLDCYCSWGRQAHRLPCWTCVGRNGRRDWHCKAGCVQCSIVTCFCNIIMLSPVTRLFSWTNCDPHLSVFKFQTAVLSVLCVMFLLQLYFALKLFSDFPVRLPNVSVNILLLFRWLQSLPVWLHICCISAHKLLYCSLFSAAFCAYFCPPVLPRLSVCMFSLFFVFNYHTCPVCLKFSVCVHPLIQ
jgi:hypothetical protein